MKIFVPTHAVNFLGPAIRLARKSPQIRLSQDELCQRLHVMGLHLDRSMISRIESRQRGISDIELILFLQALRLSLQDLIALAIKSPPSTNYNSPDHHDDLHLRVAESSDSDTAGSP